MKKLLLVFVLLLTSALNFAQNSGQPINLTACVDVLPACFDLTVNTPNVLGTLNPSEYNVEYYSGDFTNPGLITNPTQYCPVTSPYYINVRLEHNNGTVVSVTSFTLTSSNAQIAGIDLSLAQCDSNMNGTEIFNLTSVEAQLSPNNTFQYYSTLANAQAMANPIANPTTWSVTVQNTAIASSVYVREIIAGSCDVIHKLNMQTFINCNFTTSCSSANSLCGSLGLPFSNTVSVPQSGPMGCLGSTPNGTWFYMPIGSTGVINLTMNQRTQPNGGNGLDVDYIIMGPFTDPIATCGNPSELLSNIVGCSYSTAPVETVSIQGQQGQYYLLLITNFSNQAGYITVSQTNIGQAGSGTIGCSGLRFNAFYDTNTNGTKDSGEQDFPLGQFHFEKNDNGTVHHITAPSGYYEIYDLVPANTYDVSYTIPGAYSSMYTITPASYSNLNVPSAAGYTLYNFAVTSIQNYDDIEVVMVPLSSPRPGFTYQNKILYRNNGTQNVSGTLTFTKDSNVTITNNTESGAVSTTSGFTFDFTNLAPFETRSMTLTMQVPTIPTVAAGQELTNSVSIVPLTGDITPENNSSTVSQIIVNAYDPNDKMEAHGERILHSSFTPNDYLYYTIRFENTGTASAWNVRVTDLLDPKLDETSIRMVNASHVYEMDRVGNNLTWTFDQIQLPVSVANTNIGKGYFTFKIKPKAGYAVGDIITNSASIYFDFNPAIITNVFTTQFVALGVDQFENNDFAFYPNPTSGTVTVSMMNNQNNIASILVYDVLGKTILSKNVSGVSTETIDVSNFNSGMYFIEVTTDSNLKVVKKLMKN